MYFVASDLAPTFEGTSAAFDSSLDCHYGFDSRRSFVVVDLQPRQDCDSSEDRYGLADF